MAKRLLPVISILSMIPILVALVGLAACDTAEPPAEGDVSAENYGDAKDAPAEMPAVGERKRAVEVSAELEVSDLDAFERALTERQEELGGHIEDARVSGRRGAQRHGQWVVRVPAEHEEAFTDVFEEHGELLHYKRTSEDVTADMIDVHARLVARRAEERRLLELMDSETGELEDVLAVSKELSRVRAGIEEYEGRQAQLVRRSAMPIVTVMVTEIPAFDPTSAPTYSQRMSRTFFGSLKGGKAVAEALGLALIALVPWLLPILGGAWLGRALIRRRKAA